MIRRLAVLTALVLGLACAKPEEQESKPVVSVRVARAERADVLRSVSAPALIHPRQQASIAARITAPIRELLAHKGDRVASGALLARLDDRDVLAQRAEAEATLHQAEVLAERRRQLFEEGAIPQRELLASQTELLQAKARLELIAAQLRYAELRSPFAGTLTEQLLYPGDMAKPDSPVFTLADLGAVVARAQVAEAEAAAVRLGQQAEFVPADRTQDAFRGRITVSTRAVDPARRSVEVWCELANANGALLPGVFGELRIAVGVDAASVVVPQAAVEFAMGTSAGSVMVVDAQNVAHRREVVAGVVSQGRVQIQQGLDGGENVVVEGGYGLPDGTAVRIAAEKAPQSDAPERK